MHNQSSIDDLVRQSLETGEERMNLGAWANMERMLDGENPYAKKEDNKKRGFWLFGILMACLSVAGLGSYQYFSGNKNALAQNNATVNNVANASIASVNSTEDNSYNKSTSNATETIAAQNASFQSESNNPIENNMGKTIAAVASTTKSYASTSKPNSEKGDYTSYTTSQNTTIKTNRFSNGKDNCAASVKDIYELNHTASQAPTTVVENTDLQPLEITTEPLKTIAVPSAKKVAMGIKNNKSKKQLPTTMLAHTEIVATENTEKIKDVSTSILATASNKSKKQKDISFTNTTKKEKQFTAHDSIVKVTKHYKKIKNIEDGKTSTGVDVTIVKEAKPQIAEDAKTNNNTENTVAANNITQTEQEKTKQAEVVSTTIKLEAKSSLGSNNNTTNKTNTNNINNTTAKKAEKTIPKKLDNTAKAVNKDSKEIVEASAAKAVPAKATTSAAKPEEEKAKAKSSTTTQSWINKSVANLITKTHNLGYLAIFNQKFEVNPGVFAGINYSMLQTEHNFGGFQAGANALIQIAKNLNLIPHLGFYYKNNGGYSVKDNAINITNTTSNKGFDSLRSAYSYSRDSIYTNHNFKHIYSLEAPILLQYSKKDFGFYGGINVVYAFKMKTNDLSKSYKSNVFDTLTVNAPYSFPGNKSSYYKSTDFQSRFGLGYVVGMNYDFHPNLYVDIRMVKNFYDNSTTVSAVEMSNKIFKVPSFQLGIGYRFKEKERAIY